MLGRSALAFNLSSSSSFPVYLWYPRVASLIKKKKKGEMRFSMPRKKEPGSPVRAPVSKYSAWPGIN